MDNYTDLIYLGSWINSHLDQDENTWHIDLVLGQIAGVKKI